MKILAYSFFFSGAILVVVGTMRAIVAKSLVQSLHYFGISDTIGLSLLALSAFFFELLNPLEAIVLIGILIVSGPVVSHIIARAFLNSQRR
ncbi:MAG: sodium:proton antiporter [Thermotogae bacterium]|uniref:monovalent cation/H(+) antiporter subunit G n=1 Tax=Kosmotoga sp. TaxID=1955248 RepID=UPI000F19FACC|nr:monovalent cation/H(+) antiporter subunit G [Kosmotoga sp.]MBO8166742.1 monovalent cation/H(+) antiporter subunit G [Kosmotoga sp.]RKX49816.1 MAG: sodium:proton antiporter [Thermotogota bacterium]